MRLGLPPLLAFALAATVGACGDETSTSDADASSSGAGSSSSEGSSSSSAAAGDSTTAAGSTTLVWPPDDGLTQCIRTCDGPFDCCPAGSEGSCPGPYPWNVDCIDGLCVPGQCASDSDCPTSGPLRACRAVDGLRMCVTLCDDDPEVCAQPDTGLACSGVTDEGASYCAEHCDGPNVFCGNQSCDLESGQCVCTDSGQCIAGWVCL